MGDKQEIKEAINQLENLRCHCAVMSNSGESEEFKKDVKALELAIEYLKKEFYSEKADIIKVQTKGESIFLNIWEDDLKKKARFLAKMQAIERLKTKIIKQDLIKMEFKESDISIEARAELDVVKKEV